MNWLKRSYQSIWYHVSAIFCKNTALRRPWTYWMRDQLHDRPVVFWLATATLLLGVAAWLVLAIMAGAWLSAIGAFIVNDFLFMLLAHLIWGSKIRYGQQERPEYIEKEH